MIEPQWKRIAGIHALNDGIIGAVWMAHNTQSDTIHLYDCCLFKQEVLAVIGEGLNARGRWIPVAWQKKDKDISDKLLERGCNMLYDPNEDSQTLAEVISRDVWERMRTGRFKVDKRLSEWLDEYKSFYRDKSQVPQDSHPLMSATRHAVAQLSSAKRQSNTKKKTTNYPKLAII